MEGKAFEPYFDLKSVAGGAKYVIFWLDSYSQNLLAQEQVYDRLRVIFSSDSPNLTRVFDGFEFRAFFSQRLGKKRLYHLACHLLIINKDIFNAIDWEMELTKRAWKKLMKRKEKAK